MKHATPKAYKKQIISVSELQHYAVELYDIRETILLRRIDSSDKFFLIGRGCYITHTAAHQSPQTYGVGL